MIINKIGIDKIHIKLNRNIEINNRVVEIIEGIDINQFNKARELYQDKVTIDTSYPVEMIKDIKSDKEINLKYLSVRDDILFNSFKMYSYELRGNHFLQVEFDIFVRNNNNNMLPNSVEQVKKYYKYVVKHIRTTYGIYLNPNVILVEQIEINSTFQLEREYSYYNYLLELFYKLAPRSYQKCINVTTFYLSNNSTSVKTYDKTEQLKQKSIDSINLIRFEYTLKNRRKIKEIFNTYNLCEITDEQIQDFFKKSIQKDFLNVFEKHMKKSNKLIKSFADEAVQENNSKNLKSRWINSFIIKCLSRNLQAKLSLSQSKELNQSKINFTGESTTSFDIPILIDKKQIVEQIKRIYKSNSSRYIKLYSKELDELKKYQNTFEKYREIKNKLLQNTINFDENKK